MSRVRPLLAIATLALSSLLTRAAAAENDCPPGSAPRTEDGFSWCEPTVCVNDASCKPSEVCRPVALCMEVGTLADAATIDGGRRLVVTGRCVAGQLPGDPKTCPQRQTCSEMNRCVTKAAAEKLGILAAPSAAPTAGGGAEAKKASCGCDAVGAAQGFQAGGVLAIAMVAGILRRRRR